MRRGKGLIVAVLSAMDAYDSPGAELADGTRRIGLHLFFAAYRLCMVLVARRIDVFVMS